MSNVARRQDEQHKIILGSLIIKAGLRDHNRAFILGALITAAEHFDDPAFREAMTAKGRLAFAGTGEVEPLEATRS